MKRALVQAAEEALRQLRMAARADLLTCYFLNPYSGLFWLFCRDGKFTYEAQMHGPLTRPRQTERLLKILEVNNLLAGGIVPLDPLPQALQEGVGLTDGFVKREKITRSIWLAVGRKEPKPAFREDVSRLAAVIFLNYRHISDVRWNALLKSGSAIDQLFPLLQKLLLSLVDESYMGEQEAFQLRNTSLRFYRRLAQVLIGGNDESQKLYDFIVKEASRLIVPRKGRNLLCWLALLNAKNEIEVKASSSSAADCRVIAGDGIVEYVSRSGQIFLVSDTRKYQALCGKRGPDPSLPPYLECIRGARSELACPLIAQEKVLGVINLESDTADAYEPHHILMALQFSALASLAVRQAALWQDLGICLDAQPRVIEKALNMTEDDVLRSTVEATEKLGFGPAVWDFKSSQWIGAPPSRPAPRDDGYTNWIRQEGYPIVLADIRRGQSKEGSFSYRRGEVDPDTELFRRWTDVLPPPCSLSPELLRETSDSPRVLTDLGFPIFDGQPASPGKAKVRAILWAKCRRRFDAVMWDEVWALSVLSRSASIALGVRSQVHSGHRSTREAFLKWHFGPERYTEVAAALERDKKVLQPRVVPDIVVLNMDIRGSTQLGKALNERGRSGLNVKFITDYHKSAFDRTFEQCGVVDKTMGDGLHLLFNVYQPDLLDMKCGAGKAKAMEQALETAVTICKDFKNLLEAQRPGWGVEPDVPLGAALVAGEAYVGSFAGDDMAGLDYTALGKAPNAAGKLVNDARWETIVEWIEKGRRTGWFPLEFRTGRRLTSKGVDKLLHLLDHNMHLSIVLADFDFSETVTGRPRCYTVRHPGGNSDVYVVLLI